MAKETAQSEIMVQTGALLPTTILGMIMEQVIHMLMIGIMVREARVGHCSRENRNEVRILA